MFACTECGGPPKVATIAHPLHFKGTVIGLGSCRYEEVVYCPTCEPEPEFHGAIEYYDQTWDEYLARQLGYAWRLGNRLLGE